MSIPRRSQRWQRVKPSDPRVAERFEVYACGVELANGFGELIDAQEQRLRFTASMDEKDGATANAIRSTRSFWPRWHRCRRLAAWR